MAAVLPASIPIETVAPGTTLARIHRLMLVEPFFGPAPGDPPDHRFHDPAGKFRVCFLGEHATASFVETFLRSPPVGLITLAEIATRRLTTFDVLRELRLAKLRDEGLARLGCTAEITSSSPPYADPQRLSRDLWQHADQPDGIQYRCRHDNGLLAIALYDRAETALSVQHSENLGDDHDRLLQWSGRYGFSLA
jgi:RES domain-containing protein